MIAATVEVMCELCPVTCVGDEDQAERQGWAQSWDGWLCPSCRMAIEAEQANLRG